MRQTPFCEMKFSEIMQRNRELGEQLGPKRTPVTVLENVMTPQLAAILEYRLRIAQVPAEVRTSDYDNIVQDSARVGDARAVVVFWEAANFIDGGQYRIDLLSEPDLAALRDKVLGEIDLVLANLSRTPLVVFNRFSALPFSHRTLRQTPAERLCAELNQHLLARAGRNVAVIDLDKVYATVGVDRALDLRTFYSSKILHSVDFFRAYVDYVAPLFLAANGRMKKALVLDCDNTLWKGVLGEDGFDKIQLSRKQRDGVPFEEVQSLALRLARRGVIIGLCSKNNAADVDEVLQKHPDMVLRDADLVIKKVSWDDKATSLATIASQLNIGLDSIVFVDDSPFEANLIREALPAVHVIEVPERGYDYPRALRAELDLFYNLTETAEDLQKIQQYKEQAVREGARQAFADMESYLRSLELTLTVYENPREQVGRLAQLTQKTNQFNLTTRRYTEADVQGFLDGGNHRVISFAVRDRFGDAGITGLSIVELSGESARLDSLLMSCRVIGRNLERAFFDFVIDQLKRAGARTLEACYLKTLKNGQVRELYDQYGLTLCRQDDENRYYTLDLTTYKPAQLDYIRIEHG